MRNLEQQQLWMLRRAKQYNSEIIQESPEQTPSRKCSGSKSYLVVTIEVVHYISSKIQKQL